MHREAGDLRDLKPGPLDIRPNGSITNTSAGKRSKKVELVQNLLRTLFFVGLFLIVCKLTHFRQKMLYDVRINRKFLGAFYFSCFAFLMLYLYMVVTLRLLRPKESRVPVDRWDREAPIPMYVASACVMFSVICFIVALWPCFKLFTFVIGTLGFISTIFVLQWIPI